MNLYNIKKHHFDLSATNINLFEKYIDALLIMLSAHNAGNLVLVLCIWYDIIDNIPNRFL